MKTKLFLTLTLCASLFFTVTGYAGVKESNKEKQQVTDLIKIDNKMGDGTIATSGKQVFVHYTGWLYDEAAPNHQGRKFDSSRDRGQPFDFPLGAGYVIKGWDQGVEGMKIGGQRTLIIPAALGYGARGAGGVIPPNAKLIFDVELIDVR